MSNASDLTLFLVSCGQNPNYYDARDALNEQTAVAHGARIEEIRNVAPMSAAFQAMIDRCQSLWAKKYVLLVPPLGDRRERKGFFIHGKNRLSAANPVGRYQASQSQLDPPVGQGIGPLVPGVPRMALDPAPVYPVPALGHQPIKLLPQIHILDGLLGSGLPAFGFPARQPLCDAFENVLAVQVQGHCTGPLEREQRLDDSRHFHTVIGSPHFSAKKFFFGTVG